MEAIDRFKAKTQPEENGCLRWTGCINGSGYGKFRISQPRRTVQAHRWYYEYLNGPVAPHLEMDHLCRNRACVNPAHLEPVTRSVNQKRSPLKMKKRDHCARGHAMEGRNVLLRKDGKRNCRACKNEATRLWKRNKRNPVSVGS